MTATELQAIESQLQERGYKKWTYCLTSRESWGWFKTFGEGDNEWQIEFRVWDYRKYMYYNEDAEPFGFDMWTSPKNGQNNDFECGWEPIADIATFERMAAEFNQLVRKYVNDKQE